MMHVMRDAQARIAALGADLAQAPDEWRQLLDALTGTLLSGTGVRAVTYGLILLLVGGSVEWLYWTYAYGPLRLVQSAPAGTPLEALRLAARKLLLMASGVLLFTLATLATSAAFSWPAGVHETVVAATLLLLVVRLCGMVAVTVLAPGRASLRLVPVDTRRARWMVAIALLVAFLAPATRLAPDLILQAGRMPHAAGALRLVLGTASALVLLAAAFAFFDRNGRSARIARRLPRFPRAFMVAALVAVVYAVWLLATPEVSAVAMVLALVAVVQLVLRDAVFFLLTETTPSQPGLAGEPARAAEPGLLPRFVLSGVRFGVVTLGLGALAVALDTPLAELATRQGPLVRFAFSLLGVAALALLTHLAWRGVRTSIDQRLQRIGPHDPHGDPNPEARLRTLLPLLRVSAAMALGILLVLSSLWAVGIEITPLLAGAGVIGLALGFGAQALVRDVIAGIFFLAEDAFRIGEYVESGNLIKGTVERITLRTVALRHHNGPLYFVPYGALGSVRNNSRDWVIEKFNLPLPIEVDSEKVRKLIKKVGEAMLQDPEVGHLLREPLKGKLSRIDPGVKVFRCKFETAPGKQFDVRAQALKRLEEALRQAGIGFADGRQTVFIQRSDDPLQIAAA